MKFTQWIETLPLRGHGRMLLLQGVVAALVFGLFVWHPTLITSLASSVSDTYYARNPYRPSPDVVFVAVDHEAVKRLGRWPWSREVLGRLIRKLDQSAVVALDMVFSETTSAAEDQALGEALAATTAVGGFQFNGVIQSHPDEATLGMLANSALSEAGEVALVQNNMIELSIPPILAGTAALAALNTLPDGDERFRHYPVALMFQQFVMPELGLQSLRIFLNAEASLKRSKPPQLAIAGRRVALNERGFTRLNFYPPESFTVISFAEVAAPDFDPARVKGKIVLLGVTEAGITDIRATPLGQYPGALMHGTFMSNVLGGHTLSEVGKVAMAGLLLLVALASFALSFLGRIAPRVAGYLLLVLGAYGLGWLGYVQFNLWLESAYLITSVILSALLIETSLLGLAKEHSRKLRGAFSAYVPPALVDRIAEQPDKLNLGGEKKLITVLFSDIRGFTSLSETMSPELLASTMLQYFQPMTEVIFAAGGTLDKYIGDAIMALFNAPLDQADHAEAACRAAAAMQYAQLQINETLQARGAPPMRTGIGVNTGYAVVGNLGSHIRFNYTAIGDSVNLASRFESSTKTLGVDIVIGETTYELVKDKLPCRPLGETSVAGKEKPQKVYELCWKEMAQPVAGSLKSPL